MTAAQVLGKVIPIVTEAAEGRPPWLSPVSVAAAAKTFAPTRSLTAVLDGQRVQAATSEQLL